jgi:amino acid transporter
VGESGLNTAEGFFKAYLALPIVIMFWAIGFAWKRTGWLRTHQIDVDTGRREVDWEAINNYRALVAGYPAWRRILNKLF